MNPNEKINRSDAEFIVDIRCSTDPERRFYRYLAETKKFSLEELIRAIEDDLCLKFRSTRAADASLDDFLDRWRKGRR